MRLIALLVLSVVFVVPRTGRADPPGAILKLDAHTGIGFDGATGQMHAWFDQSASNFNASQTVAANKPIYVANGINGHPAVRFNGTSQFFNVAGQVITSQQFTVIAVVSDTRAGSDLSHREIFSNWTINNQLSSVFLGTTRTGGGGTDPQVRFTDNFAGVGSIAYPATPFLLAAVNSSTNATVYKNAIQIASKGSSLDARNLSTAYTIGTQGTLANEYGGSIGGEYWQGDIGALYVYDRALSAAEIVEVQNDLGVRFGFAPVPEPATVGLVAAGGLALLAWRRRRALSPVA